MLELTLTPTYRGTLTLTVGARSLVLRRDSEAMALELATALRGEPGLDGISGEAILREAVAGAALGGHRAVYVEAGVANYASADNATSAAMCVGITRAAAVQGAAALIITAGLITEPSWSWAAGPVYLGINGALTQTAPTSGSLVRIGIATSPIEVDVRVEPPIQLA
jgi:hypothetical protein